MLEKLTKEQEELMYNHRRYYIDFIVNNGKYRPQNLELSQELRDDIDWVYKKANLIPPKFILIAKSFLEEKLMINMVFHMFKESRSQVENQVWSQVRSQVGSQVWNQVRSQVENQVRSQVWNQVWSQVRSQVGSQVESQVWNQVWSQVRNKKLEWVEQGFGLPWNSWFSFYSYFNLISIVNNPDFDRYFGLVKNHGLWSIQFFENWCIVTQLPHTIRRDNENRLHSTDVPSIEWRNGQKDYYIHGVYFEPELWENVVSGLMPAKDVLKIENMEQRQAALSVISLSKILKEMNADLISIDTKPVPKLSNKYVRDFKKLDYSKPTELYCIDGEKLGLIDEQVKIIHYFCPSTGREYFDFVPPEIKTVNEGMSWKFGLSIKEYMEGMEVET